MKLKIFFSAFISLFIVSFPQNIIGCGPGVDPYDYYTSFFNNSLAGQGQFEPFYYTTYSFLYNEQEPEKQENLLAKEWADYCGNGVSADDASDFVMKYAYKDLRNLYYHLEKQKPLSVPAAVAKNSMTSYFKKTKDLEALGYIMYAKEIEPAVTGFYDDWDRKPTETAAVIKFVKSGQQLYAAAKKDLFKLKYGYQVTRLAHYNDMSSDALKYYDQYISGNTTESILQLMSLSLKAGALYRVGNKSEAAYLFSKVFGQTDVKKLSSYLGFSWSTDLTKGKNTYLKYCKNNTEKANMLAMFSFNDPSYALPVLDSVFQLDAKLPALKLLATREVNKLEETLLTPLLNKENGGKQFYYTWSEPLGDSTLEYGQQYAKKLGKAYEDIAASRKTGEDGFYYNAAAYLFYMARDMIMAKKLLDKAEAESLNPDLKDQWQLTTLLVNINNQDKIDADFEASLLTSMQWLDHKATTDAPRGKKPSEEDFYYDSHWKKFYRNLCSEILAKKYHAQGDIAKESLMIGVADKIYATEPWKGSVGIDYMHDNMDSKQVENLYNLMISDKQSAFEKFLLNNSSVKKKEVIDFAGTAYLREAEYEKAIKWFKKSNDVVSVDKNPFIELFYDREKKLSKEKGTFSKQAFAEEMLRLQTKVKNMPTERSLALYKMGLGLYNITYYGHTWELITYYRSGSDGYRLPKNANAFERDYYGCFAAEAMFKEAMEATTDPNLKAKSLFMMAKCAQKQVRQPDYYDFSKYEEYEVALQKYQPAFESNKYFPELYNNYKTTAAYQDLYTRCSFLRDFVRAKK